MRNIKLGLEILTKTAILAKIAVMDITATELKNRLGQYLDVAETEPVIIEKSGRKKSVLISHTMYERLVAFEDANWGERARKAEARGYVGQKVVKKLLERASK
jgi:antitoxin Phd